MKRDNLFWGGALIILGILFFLEQQGIITNVFRFFWPVALILVGVWVILNVYWRPAASEMETFSMPLGAAKSARIKFAHGVGQIEIGGGAAAGQALTGTTAAGMNKESRLEGDRLEIKVEAGPSFVPFVGPSGGVWQFQLTEEIPLTLIVEAGASSLNIDLENVQARRIELKTGASNSNLVMPRRGVSVLDVEAGAASVNVRIPAGTAGRIHAREGVSSVSVDTNRFPRLDSGYYQSPDFDTAADRAEINIEAGLGSISVK